MRQFEISTDSTCDLYADEIKSLGVFVEPLCFTLEKNKNIEEYLDDFKTQQEYVNFYQNLRSGHIARTSVLSLHAHIELFTKMAEQGIKKALHICLSAGLSPIIDNANRAIETVKEKFPYIDYKAIESSTATIGEGMLVKLACKLRDEGKSRDEVLKIVETEKTHLQHFIIVDDLMYLKRGGRISAASAAIGTLLAIKPIIEFTKQGKLEVAKKEKGLKKAMKTIVEEFAKYEKSQYFDIEIVHTDNEPLAKQLADMFFETYHFRPEIRIMGPVIGSHFGPGGVAYAFLSNQDRPL